jgi:hypothetical protein
MNPIQMDAVVGSGGKVEVNVPFPEGTAVKVLIGNPALDTDETDLPVEWDDELQAGLDALDRGEVDPRPWREIVEEMKERLARRGAAP